VSSVTAASTGAGWRSRPYADLFAAAGARYDVDPALLSAIARAESGYTAGARSHAGAIGLMQIMPDTASYLTGQAANGSLRGSLRDPGINLALGQRYIAYLSQHEMVHGDLLRLLASYNAGPGNFARWGSNIRHATDPLLFVEAVPINETRFFITRVLTNTWIYAARMHLPSPSLDELAAGLWPSYHPLAVPTPFAALH
jgi:soluble lytic murein transglycosylase-like protein